MTTGTNTKPASPHACRKCKMYPTISRVEMDGKTQDKVACPKCGLAIYAAPDAQVTALERWNSINKRDASLCANKNEARTVCNVASKSEISRGMDEANVAFNFRSASWFDDEDYNAFD